MIMSYAGQQIDIFFNYNAEVFKKSPLKYFPVVISNGRQAGEILKISHIRSK